ncbi:hypothetical protein GUJ93_ZPchr0003g17737 [Zizania palustris]|uniref:Uncharacterized protein n=1 Tax=Zizania palustris TaxID=103762 RepID=A0A8J5SMX8_ZIZPA|nr:hypothetical protein GUJ93_ZPchr0003g17737 [Zizania palustris]
MTRIFSFLFYNTLRPFFSPIVFILLLPPSASGGCELREICAASGPSGGRKAKMLDIQKRRVQLLLSIIGILALSMTAEKFRELVGKEAASKSGQFTFMNCFDMGSGSLACTAKEGVKMYVYNLRTAHMEMVRQRAIEKALADAVTEGLTPAEAAKQAQKVGAKAAKVAARQAKRILGPIISSGWDFFEAIYFGGSMTEGFLRGTGTLFGTYVGGFHGEERLGKLGYLAGSHLGSWVGGRIGLMIYDVINGLNYMLQFVNPEYESPSNASEDSSEYADNYPSAEREETTYYETSEEKQEGFSLF